MFKMATVFAAGLALIAMATGCTESKTDIINHTNAVYKNIKVIVTDEEISAMIPDDTMAALADAERVYLEAVQVLEQSDSIDSATGRNALLTIVTCADVILKVIDTLDVLEKYEPVITAARLSVKLLRSNISIST